MRHLRSIIIDSRIVGSIVNYLPMVQRTMNTLEKDTTGLTPAEMLFGNNLRFKESIFSEKNVVSNKTTFTLNNKYIDTMLSAQQEQILKIAR